MRFVGLVRSLSIDPIVVRQNWLDAYDYTTDKGAAVLNDYARVNDPFARIGKESVTVRQPGWNGGRLSCPSCCKPRALKNDCAATRWASTSMGCRYVNGLSWSRELDSSEGAKP